MDRPSTFEPSGEEELVALKKVEDTFISPSTIALSYLGGYVIHYTDARNPQVEFMLLMKLPYEFVEPHG